MNIILCNLPSSPSYRNMIEEAGVLMNCEVVVLMDLLKQQKELVNNYILNDLLIPDKIILELTKEKISKNINDIILVGYPRTMDQLDAFLKFYNKDIDDLLIVTPIYSEALLDENNIENKVVHEIIVNLNELSAYDLFMLITVQRSSGNPTDK